MKRKMIIVISTVIGTLLMIPFVAQAPPPIATIATAELRCPRQLGLDAVTGKVVYLYAPRVVSVDKMEVRFRVSSKQTACNCKGFLYQSNPEEVKAVYAALLTAVNNCKLDVTFCCASGIPPTGVMPPGTITPKPPEDWCAISSISINPE